ncbi:MAG: amidohydrolase family protein [Kiritimatiellia bacterium]|jgi:L-fuconolactonase|nr:amidohydrolase family protein [Kiritimatiellia bacterium]
MIDIPIVDSHLHVWNPETVSYPWLIDLPKLNRPHLPDEYREITNGLLIEKMVFVQCEADFAMFREEVDWVSEQAALEPRIKAIVAWAPLEKGEAAREDLAGLKENMLVRGIRRIIQFEEDTSFCLQPDFIRGVQLLAEFDLHFEICIKGDEQFKNTLELVRQCPDVRFMLDHIGKPFIKEGIMDPWAGYLRELARMPNTFCKMSGLVNEADMEQWTSDDLRPYIDRVIGTFGVDRITFGGDWPVCTLATTYGRWIQTLWDTVSGCNDDERHKLFHDNAEKFYRL